jgi:hypothetical protein
MIIKTKDDFQHPAGQIQLLDGRVLDCYPSEGPKCEVENELRLDTTGTYLVVGRQKKPIGEIDKSDDEKKELEKLFLDNAFVLLANKERILSDSRMFLCPLPFCRNGLAYTGTSGFHRPTFMKINTRYDKAKSDYDAYTLRQVLCILENEGSNKYLKSIR